MVKGHNPGQERMLTYLNNDWLFYMHIRNGLLSKSNYRMLCKMADKGMIETKLIEVGKRAFAANSKLMGRAFRLKQSEGDKLDG